MKIDKETVGSLLTEAKLPLPTDPAQRDVFLQRVLDEAASRESDDDRRWTPGQAVEAVVLSAMDLLDEAEHGLV